MPESLPLIPRTVLFGNPQRTGPRLSPDGERMAYLAPDDGVLNVWVRTIGADDDRVVTSDRTTGIRMFFWSRDGERILYLQDLDGDENWHLFSVGLEGGEALDLTPHEGATVGDIITDHNHPNEALVALNARDPQLFDLHRVDLQTGESSLEAENPGNYVGWLTDHDFRVRGATAAMPDGGFELLLSKTAGEGFESFLTWGPHDNGGAHGFTPDGQGLYIEDSLESDTTQVYSIDLESGKKKVLAHDKRVDAGPVMRHPEKHHVQAVGFALHQLEWKILDDSINHDFEALGDVCEGEMSIVSRDFNDRHWLVAYTGDAEPVRYYSWDRETREATFVFTDRPELEKWPLAPMKPITVRSRDGLDLVSYLTVPPDAEPENLPLVLNVHGGPWVRDEWGYDAEAQWFAKPRLRGAAGELSGLHRFRKEVPQRRQS